MALNTPLRATSATRPPVARSPKAFFTCHRCSTCRYGRARQSMSDAQSLHRPHHAHCVPDATARCCDATIGQLLSDVTVGQFPNLLEDRPQISVTRCSSGPVGVGLYLVAEHRTPRLLAARRATRVRSEIKRALLLGQRCIDVQHERIDVATQSRTTMNGTRCTHQAGNEMNIAAEAGLTVTRRLDSSVSSPPPGGLRRAVDRLSNASAPLPVSTSTNSPASLSASAYANATNCLALGFKAETAAALTLGANSVIGDERR